MSDRSRHQPVPKPESTKKTKKKGGKAIAAPTKTVNTALVEERKRSRADINNTNRQRGKTLEREVAKRTGGERTPGSGAIKNSVKNLEGDVRVRDADNRRDALVIECKSCSTLSPDGDHTFTLKRNVLEQATKEADLIGAIGLVYLHWVGANYNDDYVIFKAEHFYRWLDLARTGAAMEN